MKSWLKSGLIAAIVLTPLNGVIAFTSFTDISSIDHEAPQKAKSSLTASAKMAASAKIANDFVFDLKVQAGIVPPPVL